MAFQIVERGARYTHYQNPQTGLFQSVLTIHDQHYQDNGGFWQPITEDFVADGQEGFALRADRLRHTLRTADDGTRRWYPRRNVPTEYVEFGRPQFTIDGGATWSDVPMGGAPTRTLNTILWDRPTYSFALTLNWHRVKLDITLKTSGAARRIRWPVALNNLTFSNRTLFSGATPVGSIDPFIATDANGVDRPVSTTIAGGFVEFSANLTGAAFPVVIDPTFTSQPDATAGIDAFTREDTADTNNGTATTIAISGLATSRRIGLLKFDLSSLTGVTVTSSTLSLWNGTVLANSRTQDVFPIKAANSAWTEAGATWNYAVASTTRWAGDTGANGGTDAGCSVSGTDYNATASGSFVQASSEAVDVQYDITLVTADVQAMIAANYGWSIVNRDAATGTKSVRSSDYATDATKRPQLVVVYTTAAAGTGARLLMAGMRYGRQHFVSGGAGIITR